MYRGITDFLYTSQHLFKIFFSAFYIILFLFHAPILGVPKNDELKPQVLSRTIPPAVVDQYLAKIAALEENITEMLEQEKYVISSISIILSTTFFLPFLYG